MLAPCFDRIVVWKQTQEFFKNKPPVPSEVIRRETEVTEEEVAALPRNFSPGLMIAPRLVYRDCIDVAVQYKENGYNPILLNMADWMNPGGSVDMGAAAQEEELFRRSDYHKHLAIDYYPLGPLDSIVSRRVQFFRYGAPEGYTLMDQAVAIDCIAAAALVLPPREGEGFARDAGEELMRKKIRALLYTAAQAGNDTVILSAWGCGSYACPPIAVARLFKEVLAEFRGVFRATPFAILGSNFQPFSDVFMS